MTDLYNEGVGAADWVAGFSTGSGSQQKQSDHLLLVGGNVVFGSGQRTYVTDATVDLSSIDAIEIDWTNDGSGGSDRESYLIASTSKTGDHSTFDARLAESNTFARRTDTLDVSALTGAHHIRVHARCSSSAESQVKTYRVTLIAGAHRGSGTVEAVGELDGEGAHPPSGGAGDVEAVGELEGEGYRRARGSGTVEAVGELDGTGYRKARGAGWVEAVASLLGTTRGHLHTPPPPGYEDSDYTFTRSSIAYLDGVEHAADVPRIDDDGIRVEEGTTNQLDRNPSMIESGVGGWDGYVATVTRDTTRAPFPMVRAEWATHPTATDRRGISTNDLTQVAGGQTVVVSAYIIPFPGFTPRVHLRDEGVPDTFMAGLLMSPTGEVVDGVPRWATDPIDLPADRNLDRVYLLGIPSVANGGGPGDTAWFGLPQIEVKPYRTSWQPGGTPRTAEKLTVPAGTAYTADAGTVEIRGRRGQQDGDYQHIVHVVTSAVDGTDGFGAPAEWHVHLEPNGELRAGTFGPAANARQIATGVFVGLGEDFDVAFTWDGDAAALWSDGVQVGSAADFVRDPDASGRINIGRAGSDTRRFLNGTVRALRFSSVVRTDDELAAREPLRVDDDTTWVAAWPANLPGPTVDADVALAFHGARRELRFRFELLDSTGAHLGWVTDDVADARVSYNALANIKATMQATIRDGGDIDWLADRIRPWVDLRLQDGSWAEWPLGVYLPSTSTRSGTGRRTVMRPVDGYDLLQLLADDASADRTTYLAGAGVVGLVRDELEAAGLDDHNIAGSDETLSSDREWPPGTTRLRRINDLLGMIGYESLHIGPRGRPVGRAWRPADERSPVWTYRDDAESVVLPDVNHELDLFAVANRWVLVASEPDAEPIVAVRQNDDPASPTSTVARGRVITDVRETVEATSQAALDAQADRVASEASQVYEAVDFTSAIMPVHWHASPLRLVWSELGLAARYVEHRWSMRLAAGEAMRHRVRRVVTL